MLLAEAVAVLQLLLHLVLVLLYECVAAIAFSVGLTRCGRSLYCACGL